MTEQKELIDNFERMTRLMILLPKVVELLERDNKVNKRG